MSIYIITNKYLESSSVYKIGFTKRSSDKILKEYRRAYGKTAKLIYITDPKLEYTFQDEKKVFKKLNKYRESNKHEIFIGSPIDFIHVINSIPGKKKDIPKLHINKQVIDLMKFTKFLISLYKDNGFITGDMLWVAFDNKYKTNINYFKDYMLKKYKDNNSYTISNNVCRDVCLNLL